MSKIQSRTIIEILGRPPEHLVESLNLLVDKLAKEKGIKILEKKIFEPVAVKDSKDLFTSFVELTLELDTIEDYFTVIFGYMPSNMEIINPETVNISNIDLTLLGNKIIHRLHEYDAIAKNMLAEREMLVQKLKEHAPQLFQQPAVQEIPNKSEKKKSKSKTSKKK
jgi:hypothetical protein